MKTTKLIVLLSFIILLSFSVNAEEQSKVKKAEMKKQTHCSIMGGEIDSTAYTDIQGQRVYHCCPMCFKKLKADPDKYFEQAAKDSIVFENIQTSCPVSGKELKEKKVSIYYKGRTVYFCCDMCIPKFDKDPKKYLDNLDKGQSVEEQKSEMKEHNH